LDKHKGFGLALLGEFWWIVQRGRGYAPTREVPDGSVNDMMAILIDRMSFGPGKRALAWMWTSL